MVTKVRNIKTLIKILFIFTRKLGIFKISFHFKRSRLIIFGFLGSTKFYVSVLGSGEYLRFNLNKKRTWTCSKRFFFQEKSVELRFFEKLELLILSCLFKFLTNLQKKYNPRPLNPKIRRKLKWVGCFGVFWL